MAEGGRGVVPFAADFTVYGGLYRDVQLIETDPLHVRAEGGRQAMYLRSTRLPSEQMIS